MNVCKWCMSGSSTGKGILLNVLPRLNKIFNQSINHSQLLFLDSGVYIQQNIASY